MNLALSIHKHMGLIKYSLFFKVCGPRLTETLLFDKHWPWFDEWAEPIFAPLTMDSRGRNLPAHRNTSCWLHPPLPDTALELSLHLNIQSQEDSHWSEWHRQLPGVGSSHSPHTGKWSMQAGECFRNTQIHCVLAYSSQTQGKGARNVTIRPPGMKWHMPVLFAQYFWTWYATVRCFEKSAHKTPPHTPVSRLSL